MKKFIAIITAAVLVFALSACASTDISAEDPSASKANAAASAGAEGSEASGTQTAAVTPKLGLSIASSAGLYQSKLADKLQAIVKSDGIDYVFSNASNNASTQLSQIKEMLTQNITVLVVQPADDTVLGNAYAAASNAGVPLVAIDTTAENANGAALTLSYNDEYIGQLAGEFFNENKQFYDYSEVNVIVLGGATASEKARSDSFIKYAEANKIKVVATVDSAGSSSDCYSNLTSAIKDAGKDNFNAIFSPSDDYLECISSACTSADCWKKLAEPGFKMLVSVGGNTEALTFLTSGYVTGVINTDPNLLAEKTIAEALKISSGETPESTFLAADVSTILRSTVMYTDKQLWGNTTAAE